MIDAMLNIMAAPAGRSPAASRRPSLRDGLPASDTVPQVNMSHDVPAGEACSTQNADTRIIVGLTQASIECENLSRSNDPMKVHVDPARSITPMRSRRPSGNLGGLVSGQPGIPLSLTIGAGQTAEQRPLEAVGDTLRPAFPEPESPEKGSLRRNRASEYQVNSESAVWEATCQALNMLP